MPSQQLLPHRDWLGGQRCVPVLVLVLVLVLLPLPIPVPVPVLVPVVPGPLVPVLVPVAVIAQLGYMDTLKRSFEIVRQNLVVVGAGELAIRFLNGFIGFFGFLASVLVALGLYFLINNASSLLALAVAVPVFFLGVSIVATVNQFIRVAYYTQVYIWAEDATMHGTAGSTAPPQPLRNAFGI